MTTKCPHCVQTFEVDISANGQIAPCTVCGKKFTISPLLIPKNEPNNAPTPQQNITQNDDVAIRMLLPVGRSGWAIAAGYLGLLSLVLVFGPFALFTGIMALCSIKKNPKLHGKGRAWFGIIMGGLATLALTAIIIAGLR